MLPYCSIWFGTTDWRFSHRAYCYERHCHWYIYYSICLELWKFTEKSFCAFFKQHHFRFCTVPYFHFLVFRSEASNNSYLFYCHNVNCYYNYLFPSMLNASLVMYMMHNERFEEFLVSGSTEKRGFFILIVYFAIFSHLPASGILAVYAGCR